jgi:pimeloyl-ACP methyl ester carboxylesterase
MTEPERQYRRIPDGEVWTLEWTGAGERAPWLHFAHATGMNAELYRPLLAPLAGDYNIVASDARGHGRTQLPADPHSLTAWATYKDDLEALLDTYARSNPWLLAGHSMGGTVTMGVAARRRDLARAVLLIEPATVPFAQVEAYARARDAGTAPPSMMEAQAKRRRWHWPSRGALRAAYHGRGVFTTWGDEWLDAYIDGGVRACADGSVELCCAPAWEAATFHAVSTTLADSLRDWDRPLTLLYGTEGSTVAPADVPVFTDGPCRRAMKFAGASHFLQTEHPDDVRTALRAMADCAPDNGASGAPRSGADSAPRNGADPA